LSPSLMSNSARVKKKLRPMLVAAPFIPVDVAAELVQYANLCPEPGMRV